MNYTLMKETNYTLTKETLSDLKEALPHGAIQEIADSTSYSRTYVNMVFNAEVPINSNNEKIIQAAQRIIRNLKENSEKKSMIMTAQINKTLNG